ncbi:hypothetical protein CYY_006219 [Polysphondylium violaceum]|uniref:Nucleolar pre-ribosomal-associated protein 1 C-terminal domain-containing protein n=1 Tax=Polysphondylium violaceum TaxID=133409 RepID=A0A8J4V655_9MYCE|nr:hypothetical protein CYY_006219 [Polysphondylium violaceum]
MNQKKLKKFNQPFKNNWIKDSNVIIAPVAKKENEQKDKQQQAITLEFVDNLSLFKFVQLLNSSSSKDIEKGLYSIIKIIRDEKELGTTDPSIPNHKNEALSLLFDYLKNSQQTQELFTIWDTCIDKYQVYQTTYALLMEFIAIILTLNDDPNLSSVSKNLSDKVIKDRFLDLQKIVSEYNKSSPNLAINCYRLLSSIIPLSMKHAKYIQTNFKFDSSGFQNSLNDLSTLGSYHGSRPFALRFLLSFLKLQNYKLTEFILESDLLLLKFCSQIQYDHHNIVLDFIESLEEYVLKSTIISKKLKIKFFTPSLLSKIGVIFSKDDIGDDCRQSIFNFLSTLCCSPVTGIISSDPKWNWFRDNENPCFENKSIVSLISELNPIVFQLHQTLFIKIIHSCPDLFVSYLKKLGYIETTLTLHWLNKTTMLIKTLSSPVPKSPSFKLNSNTLDENATTDRLLDPIPSSPMVLINMLIPPQVSNLSFGLQSESPLVTYNQLLVLLLCLKRINSVLNGLSQFYQENKSLYGERLEVFINDLKTGIKERLPSFRFFKENYTKFKSSTTIYGQFVSVLSEYVRYLPINDFVTLKMLDYSLLTQLDAFSQKQFIQLVSNSKTWHQPSNFFYRDQDGSTILDMVLKLYIGSKSLEIKDYYHQLLFKLLSINNLFSGIESEIDTWLEFLATPENIPFFEFICQNSHTNKFQYVDVCQIVSKSIGKQSQVFISPVLAAAIFYLFSLESPSQDQHFKSLDNQRYLSNVLSAISANYNCAKSILFISCFIEKKKQDTEISLSQLSLDSLKKFSITDAIGKFDQPHLSKSFTFIYQQATLTISKNQGESKEMEKKFAQQATTATQEKELFMEFVNESIWNIASGVNVDAFKRLPITLLLSQFSCTNQKTREDILVSRPDIKLSLLKNVASLSLRRLSNLVSLLIQLIENQYQQEQKVEQETLGNNTTDPTLDFYFDILDQSFISILDSKQSGQALKICDQYLSNPFVSKVFLKNFRFTFETSKLFFRIFKIFPKYESALVQKVIKYFVDGTNDKEFGIYRGALELILPFIDLSTCISIANRLESNINGTTTDQLLLFIQVLECISSHLDDNNNNNTTLPVYICQLIKNSSSPLDKFIKKEKVMQGDQVKLLGIFNKLVSILPKGQKEFGMSKLVSKFLLMDINGSSSCFSFINNLFFSGNQESLIKGLLVYCLENMSVDTHSSLILSILLKTNPQILLQQFKIVEIIESLGTDKLMITIDNIDQILPILYLSLVVPNQKISESLTNNLLNGISDSAIFFEPQLKDLFEISLKTCQYLQQQTTDDMSLHAKFNYIFIEKIANQEAEIQTSMVKNYLEALHQSMVLMKEEKSYTCVFNFHFKLLNSLIHSFHLEKKTTPIEKLIYLGFEILSNETLLLIEKFIMSLQKHFGYQYYLELVFSQLSQNKQILQLLKKNHISQPKKISVEQHQQDQLLKYRILHVLEILYYKSPSYCSNDTLSSIYFPTYNATTHPIDQVLLRIIYQHERHEYSIFSASNFLWGKTSSESYSPHHLLQSNSLLNETLLENSFSFYPVDTALELTSENEYQIFTQEFSQNQVIKTLDQFPYDPSFLLRLFLALVEDQQELDAYSFFFNGPLSFTIRSLSSNQISIRQLAYKVLAKYQALEQTSQLPNVDTKLISILKSTVYEKNQHIPNLFTIFFTNCIKVLSGRNKDGNRTTISTFLKSNALLDLNLIPLFNSHITKFSNKSIICWLLDGLSSSLPDENTEFLIKKNHSITVLMNLFDSNLSTVKIKSIIIEIFTKLSNSSSGSTLLLKQGIIPWISHQSSNSSLQKSSFDLLIHLVFNIHHNIKSNSIEFTSQSGILISYLLQYILNIEWNNEFKDDVIKVLESITFHLFSTKSNSSSFLNISIPDINSLIGKYEHCLEILTTQEKSKFLENISKIICLSSQITRAYLRLPEQQQSTIMNWITNALSLSTNIDLIRLLLDWIKDIYLHGNKQQKNSLLLNQLFVLENRLINDFNNNKDNSLINLYQICIILFGYQYNNIDKELEKYLSNISIQSNNIESLLPTIKYIKQNLYK